MTRIVVCPILEAHSFRGDKLESHFAREYAWVDTLQIYVPLDTEL